MTKYKILALFLGLYCWPGPHAQAASGTPIDPDPQQASANPRLVRITQGQDKGAILASVAPGVIYKSLDEGGTFHKISAIAYPADVTWDCCGVLYEMPQTVGTIAAGTILFSADYCEGDVMSTNIYSSSDGGNSWSFLAAPVRGGKCTQNSAGVYRGVSGDGLWEPEFEVASDGALVMFWSDETDPCCSQKLAQIRTYDGITWQDQQNTVASTNHASRPGMAVVSKTPSGKYFMTYELCTLGSLYCPDMYRVSDDGWNFGPPADLGSKIATTSGLYFQHAPRNIWFPRNGSQAGALVVVGQMLYQLDNTVSPQDGKVLFVNSSEDGSGAWATIPAPVSVPNAGLPTYTTCPNYSSTLLPVSNDSSLLEMASDTKGLCQSSYGTEPWQDPTPVPTRSLSGYVLSKSGPSSARTWTFELVNVSNTIAKAAEITGIALQQTRGAACTPELLSTQFPMLVADIGPNESVQVPVVFDFASCPAAAMFTVTATETANNGATNGMIQLLNQLR